MANNKKNHLKDLINKNINNFSDEFIDKIIKMMNAETARIDKRNKDNINKINAHKNTNTVQYKLLIKLLNIVLTNMKLKKIKVASEFTNINRINIIDPNIRPLFDTMSKKIFENFDKLKCGYYNLKSPSAVLNCIRGMCKTLNITIEWRKTKKQENSISYSGVIYSIV